MMLAKSRRPWMFHIHVLSLFKKLGNRSIGGGLKETKMQAGMFWNFQEYKLNLTIKKHAVFFF